MIFKAIKLASKVITVVAAAKTGITLYKKARSIHAGYKRVKKIKKNANSLLTGIKRKLNK